MSSHRRSLEEEEDDFVRAIPLRVHLYLHTTEPLTVNLEKPITVNVINVVQGEPSVPGKAVQAILKLGDQIVGTSTPTVPPSLTVDETNKALNLTWVDSHGDPDAATPDNAQVTFDSDNPAVATVDPTSGQITPVAEGTFNASVSIVDTSTGQPLDLNGVPVQVPPVAVQVVAGAAVGAELGIKQVS